MACDCKANRAIYELGKRYGTTANATRKDILKSGIWKCIQYVFLGIFLVVALPFLFVRLIWKTVIKGDGVLHLDEMIGLSKK